jgi:hypothetical protein
MGFLKRLAFYVGLLLGLATIAVAGTVALTYLLTGRLASIEMEEKKPVVTLMTPDEVVTMIRERTGKAEAQLDEETGGEGNE